MLIFISTYLPVINIAHYIYPCLSVAVKEYSTFLNAMGVEPHHLSDSVLCHIQYTYWSVRGFYPSAEMQSVLVV